MLTIRRPVQLAVLVALVVAAFAALASLAEPALAQKLYGCDSLIQWPCPGPAL